MSDNAALLSGTDDRRQGFHCGEIVRAGTLDVPSGSICGSRRSDAPRSTNHGTRDELFHRDPVGRLGDRSIEILNFADPLFVTLFQPLSQLGELDSSTPGRRIT